MSRKELEKLKEIVTTEPPETAMKDLREGNITVLEWWRYEVASLLILEY